MGIALLDSDSLLPGAMCSKLERQILGDLWAWIEDNEHRRSGCGVFDVKPLHG